MTIEAACAWCAKSGGGTLHSVVEMYFGTLEQFVYFECPDCASLTIVAPPTDMARFYPPAYYSLAAPPTTATTPWRRVMRHARTRFGLARVVPVQLAQRFAGLPPWMPHLRPLRTTARIIDIGSGSGRLVANLRRMGFRNTWGLDPFIGSTTELVIKGSVVDLAGRYDLVMFHHSLEHVADPQASLRHAGEVLAPGGRVLVRLPLTATEPWRRYRAHWASLDAPRHLALPSLHGFRAAADACGLRIDDWYCDATAFGWWASELYRRGVPLMSPEAAAAMPEERRATFAAVAKAANARGDGDTAVFVLSRATSPAPR